MTRQDKNTAIRAWQAITAILALHKEVDSQVVMTRLEHTPKPHVMAVQFILIGTGLAQPGLDADGSVGDYTLNSIFRIYKVATALEDEIDTQTEEVPATAS